MPWNSWLHLVCGKLERTTTTKKQFGYCGRGRRRRKHMRWLCHDIYVHYFLLYFVFLLWLSARDAVTLKDGPELKSVYSPQVLGSYHISLKSLPFGEDRFNTEPTSTRAWVQLWKQHLETQNQYYLNPRPYMKPRLHWNQQQCFGLLKWGCFFFLIASNQEDVFAVLGVMSDAMQHHPHQQVCTSHWEMRVPTATWTWTVNRFNWKHTK